MKRPLGYCRTYQFVGYEPYDVATPMRAMAQWLRRRTEANGATKGLAVSVAIDYDDEGCVGVCLTYEHPNTESLAPIPAP